jgi:hypothetical protein
MAKSDFAPWLRNRLVPDAALTQLRAFADAHAAQWPYHSNRIADYVRVVQAANDPNEDALLTTLERYFLTWKKSGGGWLSVITEFALLATGLIVVLFIFWALFKTDPDHGAVGCQPGARPDYFPFRVYHDCSDICGVDRRLVDGQG